MSHNTYESVNKPNPSNYITLGTYNEVYPLAKFKYCSSKEDFGAFSIYAAVRQPWACGRNMPGCDINQPKVPGVN